MMGRKRKMNESKRAGRLSWPEGICDIVLDTDTYNEIDDQFALAYMLRSGDKLRTRAVCAAPFYNDNSDSPRDGMEKSYEEIKKVIKLCDMENEGIPVFRGSEAYLPDENTYVESPAAREITRLALEAPDDRPLYVAAIGAITNVASAILMEPSIIEKIVVIWLGGHSLDWPDTKEFNLWQDVAAARVIFGCGVPLVMLPCMGVVSNFSFSAQELEYWLADKNKLSDYLAKNTVEYTNIRSSHKCWSKTIWDVTAVAWLIGSEFELDRFEPSPIPEYDGNYGISKNRHLIKYVYHINKEALFADMIYKLTGEKA